MPQFGAMAPAQLEIPLASVELIHDIAVGIQHQMRLPRKPKDVVQDVVGSLFVPLHEGTGDAKNMLAKNALLFGAARAVERGRVAKVCHR
ncbi:MAG TPA: hypothetical protein VNO43_06175 [Candidatus Eisenbacteria bacterium]|nr:hypothetical protein [Candidatus Eisenbacteria bacterium]